MNLANGRYGVIDIASGETVVHDLDDDYAKGPSAMLSTIDRAVSDAGGDAIVLASGLLTGSLVPAACAGFVRLPRSGSELERMCPILGFAGVELKLSGFDFVVVKGEAAQHGYIWIRDGLLEFVESQDMVRMDSWERTDAIRSEQGDRKIQVMSTGPWAESWPAASQLVINYWAGEDKIACAGEFGRRKLSAVAVRGMGELELGDADAHFDASQELFDSQIAAMGENSGLASYARIAATDGLVELLHRNVSCYGCPFPCRSYYKIFEDPGVHSLGEEEPGYLLYDIPAMERFSSMGMDPRDSVTALLRCSRFGAEPLAVAETLVRNGYGADLDAVTKLLKSGGPAEPPDDMCVEGFARPFEDPGDYVACLALGLCPRYWAKAGLDREAIAKVSGPASGNALGLL